MDATTINQCVNVKESAYAFLCILLHPELESKETQYPKAHHVPGLFLETNVCEDNLIDH